MAGAVTAHYLNEDWEMQVILLKASDMKSRHTADKISNHWEKTLKKWEIPLVNVTAVTVDGGSDYAAAARIFASRSLWCVCHRIHLINKRMIDDIQELRNLIAKGKEIVHDHNVSSKFQLEFIEKQSQHSVNKCLKLGVETRWNTYNKMLESLLENKEVLLALKVNGITSNEWKLMEKICTKFSILSTSLRTFEQSHNPTVHCVYPLLLSVSNLFKKDDDPLVEAMSAKLDQLLDVYFGIGTDFEALFKKSSLLVIATFLNPRTKSFHFLPKTLADRCVQFCVQEIANEILKYNDDSLQQLKILKQIFFQYLVPLQNRSAPNCKL